MAEYRVFADFHNADSNGRLRLNCVGTIEDLNRQNIVLRDGMEMVFYSEELEANGTVLYSTDENIWVASIDWEAIRERPQEIVSEVEQ